jgi:UMF1 family MFS transporter
MTPPGKKQKMSREEVSWILYDVANSAFVLIMVTAIMPIFYKDFAAYGIPGAVSTAHWGFANSAAALVLAILSPILGVFADCRNRKKRFLVLFVVIGLVFTVSLTLVDRGQWLLCLVLFICARIGWAGANLFYDAFLVDVATKKRMDMISTRGYGFGYIGSVIPFLIVIGLILSAGIGEDGLPVAETRLGFLVVATWWLIFSLPTIFFLKQKHYVESAGLAVSQSFAKLLTTFKNIRQHRHAFVFLIAYFFYIDGVGTIISMSTAYGRDLGFGVTMLIVVLLFIQVTAFPFALFYGRLALRYSARSMLLFGIGVYCLITLLAFMLPFLDNVAMRTMLFWLIALLVASSMGGIQALSRSYFSRLIPPENSAEFFGFYNVFGKFAAIGGPLLMGLVGRFTGDTRWGVLSILVLFVIGGTILARLQDA